jgi:hypothetical protein
MDRWTDGQMERQRVAVIFTGRRKEKDILKAK